MKKSKKVSGMRYSLIHNRENKFFIRRSILSSIERETPTGNEQRIKRAEIKFNVAKGRKIKS